MSNLPTLTRCPHCGRIRILDATLFLVSDSGLTVPAGISCHCPRCLKAAVPGATLPYFGLPVGGPLSRLRRWFLG